MIKGPKKRFKVIARLMERYPFTKEVLLLIMVDWAISRESP